MASTLNIAILGASGYTGAELIRLCLQHPHVHIAALSANTYAGQSIAEVFPHLGGHDLPMLEMIEAIDFTAIDVVFCCLPHATTQAIIPTLPKHVTIIDLSADFRLHDLAAYEYWYGHTHAAPELQKEAVYALTEHYAAQVKKARLIANPGCYPTCSLLPLLPLKQAGLLNLSHAIIVDAKSGVTGAGRSVKQNLLFNEVSEGTTPYSINQHRHKAELEQELGSKNITFVPHLLPQKRGMIATIYANLKNGTANEARQTLQDFYAPHPFVTVLKAGDGPSTHHVRGSNQCHIGVFEGASVDNIILISVIDNLMKGASGQALHNMNIRFGFTETLGLTSGVLFP
jgi:N-acetyl-gamma-glutamyl-phosphate reductase